MRQAPLRSGEVLLLAGWLGLLAPYVVSGDLIRDDWAFVPLVARHDSYAAFQAEVSARPNFTARPIAALVHGAAYWVFEGRASGHHLLNLGLFLASVLVTARALRPLLGEAASRIFGCLALVYPCASATVFVGLSMNGNLAALCLALALRLDGRGEPGRWPAVASSLLLLASALSYESFIPLLVLSPLVRSVGSGARGWHSRAAAAGPLLGALAPLFVFRTWVEPSLFPGSASRFDLPLGGYLPVRVAQTLSEGLNVALLDPPRLALLTASNLVVSAPGVWLLALGGLAALVLAVARALRDAPPLPSSLGAGSVLVWLACLLPFAASEYHVTAWGYASRTGGALRLAWAATLACALVELRRRLGRPVARVGAACVLAACAVGLVGQRLGYEDAGRLNRRVLAAIRDAWTPASHAERADQLSLFSPRPPAGLVAHEVLVGIPVAAPLARNGEPSFGRPWDLGPALESVYPGTNIRANAVLPGDVLEAFGAGARLRRPNHEWQVELPVIWLEPFASPVVRTIRTAADLPSSGAGY